MKRPTNRQKFVVMPTEQWQKAGIKRRNSRDWQPVREKPLRGPRRSEPDFGRGNPLVGRDCLKSMIEGRANHGYRIENCFRAGESLVICVAFYCLGGFGLHIDEPDQYVEGPVIHGDRS